LKWTSIRDKKPSAIAAAVPTVIVFVVAMTLVVTVGVFLTAAGCTWAAMRRKSRRKSSLSNLYMLPERGVDFNARAANLKTGTEN
jgi:hypothetical protein